MFCKSCGKEIDNQALFCMYCGTKTNGEEIKEHQKTHEAYAAEQSYDNLEFQRKDLLRIIVEAESGKATGKKSAVICFGIAVLFFILGLSVRTGSWIFVLFAVISAVFGAVFAVAIQKANNRIMEAKERLRRLE